MNIYNTSLAAAAHIGALYAPYDVPSHSFDFRRCITDEPITDAAANLLPSPTTDPAANLLRVHQHNTICSPSGPIFNGITSYATSLPYWEWGSFWSPTDPTDLSPGLSVTFEIYVK